MQKSMIVTSMQSALTLWAHLTARASLGTREMVYLCVKVKRTVLLRQKCSSVQVNRTQVHDCHLNAECINFVGSFECSCKPRYKGDGVSLCEGKENSTFKVFRLKWKLH